MRSDAIIIVGVGFQDPTQMHLAQDNDVVHTPTPYRSDQPFHKAILPGRGWCGRLVPDAHGAQSAGDDAAIDPIPIADEGARSLLPGKGLRYLTCNPFGRRICCDVDPDEVSAVEPDDDEGIEQVETDRRNNEQVHGGNVRRVVMQEGSPSLAGWPPPFDHVLGNARLRDLKPELEQFAVDAWRAPKRVFDAHPPDQRAQLHVDLRSPSQWARLQTPVATKAGPVPTHERLGPDDREDLQDRRNPAVQLDKEPAIMVRKPDATMEPTPQDNQLMSKYRVLGLKPQLRLEWRGQDRQNETEQPDHSANLGDSITLSTRIRFSVHTGFGFADRGVSRSGSTVRHHVADLYLGIGYAYIVFLLRYGAGASQRNYEPGNGKRFKPTHTSRHRRFPLISRSDTSDASVSSRLSSMACRRRGMPPVDLRPQVPRRTANVLRPRMYR